MSQRQIITIFSIIFIVILFITGWSGYQMMRFEKKLIADEVDVWIQKTSRDFQKKNYSLQNLAYLLRQENANEKLAFAAGVSLNKGKIRDFFEDEDILRQDNAIPKIYRKELLERYPNAILEENLYIKDFDSLFNSWATKRFGALSYKIDKVPIVDTPVASFGFSSSPFIINVFNPYLYRVGYDIPVMTALSGMKPYLLINSFLLLLVVASIIVYYKGHTSRLQAVTFRDSLMGNMSHELKTPIASLQLIVERAKGPTTTANTLSNYGELAGMELDRMKQIVDKILAIGKLNRNDFLLNKELSSVDELVGRAIRFFDVQGSVVITYQGIPGQRLLGDTTLLVNAFTAIIDNAIKYTNGDPMLAISVVREKAWLSINFADNGVGIDKAHFKRIFQPFFRVPTGDQHDVKGHGLGLAFVKQVVTLHDGKVSVNSQRGEGSVFTIKLPVR